VVLMIEPFICQQISKPNVQCEGQKRNLCEPQQKSLLMKKIPRISDFEFWEKTMRVI